jgi:hypothetical protein
MADSASLAVDATPRSTADTSLNVNELHEGTSDFGSSTESLPADETHPSDQGVPNPNHAEICRMIVRQIHTQIGRCPGMSATATLAIGAAPRGIADASPSVNDRRPLNSKVAARLLNSRGMGENSANFSFPLTIGP